MRKVLEKQSRFFAKFFSVVREDLIVKRFIELNKKAELGLSKGKCAEKAMAPHSNTLAWKIPWMEEPGGLQSMGSLESDTTERLHFHFSLSCTGEGNGNPLQCSCLENPRDGGAWWATVYGVAQSRTRLKRLSSSSSSKGKREEENSSQRAEHMEREVGDHV